MEDSQTAGRHIWFDNIHITNRDTAIVRQNNEVGVSKLNDQSHLALMVSPNPFINYALITYNLATQSRVSLAIYTAAGIKIRTLADGIQDPGQKMFTWDGSGDSGVQVQRGIYICILTAGNLRGSCKIARY
jgi:hypothetical protein